MSLACIVDLINPGDRQTPGTFYEYVVRYLLSLFLETHPAQRVQVPVGTDNVSLTIDLIFNRGEADPKLHVAVKTSTRERASEFWAHQRILNEAFKNDAFIGLFVGLAETKLDRRLLEVTEICVPDQWRTYQQYVAQISRVFYLDPPLPYLRLNDQPPYIVVKPFGEIFFDPLLFPKNQKI